MAAMNQWSNWGGNQTFQPTRTVTPADEAEAVSQIRAAIGQKRSVRVAGSGHSFTPIVRTDGVLFDFSKLSGVVSVDQASRRAEVLAGSKIAALGSPLWDEGLSIANQGDVDVQSISGAIATGTKGSGRAFGSMSSMVTGLRIVNGRGEVVDIDQSDPEKLRAAQVSLGLLGLVLRVGLQLVPAYRLREENIILPMAEVLRQWDFLLSEYRHFSFWWMPTDRSSHMYKLGEVPADHCFVKLLREIPADDPEVPVGEMNRRTDRAYRIYPDGTTDAEFHELEYMVGAEDARAVVERMRDLMWKRFPDEISPLQVRWQKADDAFLSAQSGRDTTSISVSGEIGRDYFPFLRAVDEALQPFSARPHWGKLHFLDRNRIESIYPDFERFQKVRKEMDPDDLFLNPHLSDLFG
ncbi:D-arabinono-14-lactone oxidase [Mesorhizobium plurifarium]|uniref:D-arabinono-14-lactone oxidase n=1 Tax=Mesorhizobium plurifarium TaxID=69974 RepID=A0A090F1W9_MESPL|nr:D-arabinono-14-lactone oxidase [Mesorhizobium plurifarium]